LSKRHKKAEDLTRGTKRIKGPMKTPWSKTAGEQGPKAVKFKKTRRALKITLKKRQGGTPSQRGLPVKKKPRGACRDEMLQTKNRPFLARKRRQLRGWW